MSAVLGLGACGLASLLFGSMFVPVRRFSAGDGIFVQWVMSIAILAVGFFVFMFQGFPGFYPLAMLGGVCWTLGNATAIPIIRRLGMALGMLIWNTSNCLIGWASGRFGLFGMTARPPASSLLNYAGLACVIVGGILFSRLESNPQEEEETKKEVSAEEGQTSEKEALNEDAVEVVKPARNPAIDRSIGFALALAAGLFYGVTFAPVNYMIDNPEKFPGFPKAHLDYAFSHYFGIFLTASALFIIYAIFRRNKPVINNEIALPSYSAGIIWAIAQSSFFVANENLSQTVTFPIITMLPGCVASAWSILCFKEITGRRNYIILAVAMTITLCGSLLTVISKDFSF